jgi:flagellar motor switch protein FliN/FliY
MDKPSVPDSQEFKGNFLENSSIQGMKRLLDIKVTLTAELGRRKMNIQDIMQLKPEDQLELYKSIHDPLDIRINGRLIAKGEAVVKGERYGIKITEIIQSESLDKPSNLAEHHSEKEKKDEQGKDISNSEGEKT